MRTSRYARRLSTGLPLKIRQRYCGCSHHQDVHDGGTGRCGASRCRCSGFVSGEAP